LRSRNLALSTPRHRAGGGCRSALALALALPAGLFAQIPGAPWTAPKEAVAATNNNPYLIGVTLLGAALLAAIAGIYWQRSLRKRIARQASKLAEQRSLLQALYDHIPVGMTVIELAPAGPRLISINREAVRLYGLGGVSVVNRPLTELTLAEGVRDHFSDVMRRRPQGNQIVHYEFEIEKGRRILEVTLVPVSSGHGTVPSLCVLVEDVSARKLMDAEIAQSRKLRAVGELVGGIAHEFNNLLTPMMLKVGEIQMDRADDAKLQAEIAVIAQAAQNAAELTRRLLTFGRKPESGAESTRLADVIASCFELLRPGVDRRILWDSDVSADLPALPFSATELNQILINLLLNARDTLTEKLAMPHDETWVPHVQVSVAALPPEAAPPLKSRPGAVFLGWQRLTVSDNGLGMPPNVVERIFEPFFTTKEVGKGTGLGLATIWHLVTELGGRVEAQSQPGAGSTFQVWLPVWPVEAQDAPDPARPDAPGPITRRILLVEDEPLVAQTVISILRRCGHQLHHVADGSDAWRHLAPDLSRYDLLIIDVNLPGMNGIDLVSRVRERKFPGGILIVSGRLGMGHLRALVEMNVDRVLTKPFTAHQLELAVRECLAERRN
jgi:PAS domain S-box-containing protein